jgi:hypothetical protein
VPTRESMVRPGGCLQAPGEPHPPDALIAPPDALIAP